MNQKQLQYFIEVYHSRNIQAAADKLYVSRQGVSKMIRSIEEELGQPLFTRTSRGMYPTDFATALLPHAETLLNEFSYISGMNTLAAQSKRVVTIYALDHIFAYFSAQLLQDFHREHPDIILSIIDTTDDAAIEGLLTKKCNMAIVTGPLDKTRFNGDKLFFSRYCVRMHKNNPLARKDSLTYQDLQGQHIIGKGRAYSCFRYHFDKHILLQNIDVDIIAETADEQLITDLVKTNQAISIGYEYSSQLLPDENIVTRPISNEGDEGQDVYLMTAKDFILTEASKTFRSFLISWIHQKYPCMEAMLSGTTSL